MNGCYLSQYIITDYTLLKIPISFKNAKIFGGGILVNSSWRLFVVKYFTLDREKSTHSRRMCLTVKFEAQPMHCGIGSPFNKYECVILVCPIIRRVNLVSRYLL